MTDKGLEERVGKSRRCGYIDVAKMIAILTVMFEHSQYYIPEIQHDNGFLIFRIWMFGFFLQTFFFTAGLVDKEASGEHIRSWKSFLTKLFTSVIVPYICWSLILGTRFDASFVKGVIWGTQTSIASAGTDGVLWFLPVLFGAKVFYRVVIRIMLRLLHKRSVPFILASATILAIAGYLLAGNGMNRIFWGADIAMMSAALMLIGQAMKSAVEKLRQGSWLVRIVGMVICLVISVMSCYSNMTYQIDNQGILCYQDIVVMAQGYFGASVLLFLISSVSTCMVILIVSMWLEKLQGIAYWGQYTLGFMLVHGKLFPFAVAIVQGVIGQNEVNCCVLAIISTVCVTVLCMPIIVFINRYIPQLLGKTNSENCN